MSIKNRICAWLYQMRNDSNVWTAAERFGSNITSISDDFTHISLLFLEEFESTWIRDLTDEEKQSMESMCNLDGMLHALDGSQFVRRRSTYLPNGFCRKDFMEETQSSRM